MKRLLLATCIASLAALTACQSASTGAASAAPRTEEMTGAQARYTIQVPQDTGATPAAAPFALQGSASESPAMAPGDGYQAR